LFVCLFIYFFIIQYKIYELAVNVMDVKRFYVFLFRHVFKFVLLLRFLIFKMSENGIHLL